MARLTAKTRNHLPQTAFAIPGKRKFPLSDKTHDREAISGATRSYRAGNISASTEKRIQADARQKLGTKKKK